MNVIVANKYQTLLNGLDIDVIKSINGVFTVEELGELFSNFYYNKMILDITAIKDYQNINVMQSLSVTFDMQKVILVLDDSESVNSPVYLSQLVSMGIYNFTRGVDNVAFLLNNPNSYKDVAQFHNLNGFQPPKLNENAKDETKGQIGQRIIGIKNITDHAGATTLVYLMKMHLEKYYKVKAVELDGQDFIYFNEKNMDSISANAFNEYKEENKEMEALIVDLNNADESLCDEVIYLIEPGLVKLNKLIRQNENIFNDLKNKKIVLNRSVLSEGDVQAFEKESGSKVFYNIPYLDDKLDNQTVINEFLQALGFSRVDGKASLGLFNIFK